MTVRDAIVDLYELDGEPSNYDPWMTNTVDYDPATELDGTSRGARHYMRKLSRAQIALANWRTRNKRPIRFHKFLTRKNVKVGLDTQGYTASRITGDAYTLRLISPPSYLEPELLEGCRVDITYTDVGTATFTESVQVTLADQNGLNIDLQFRDPLEDPAFAYVNVTADLYFNNFVIRATDVRPAEAIYMALPSRYRNILKVIDMSTSNEVFVAESKEALDDYTLAAGTPTQYYALGEHIWFNTYLTEPFWFTIEYQRLPVNITSIDDNFDIPEQWHEVLMLIVQWQEAKRLYENERSQLLRGEIQNWIEQLRTDDEEMWARTNTSGFYIRKEAR